MVLALPNKKVEGFQWSDFSSVVFNTKTMLPKPDKDIGAITHAQDFPEHNGLIAFNKKHCNKNLAIVIDETDDAPLYLTHQNGCGQFTLDVKAGKSCHLFEYVETEAVNVLARIKLEPGAELLHYRIFQPCAEGEGAHFIHHEIEVAQDAHYNAILLTSGSAIQRTDSRIKLIGEGASAYVRAACFMKEHSPLRYRR